MRTYSNRLSSNGALSVTARVVGKVINHAPVRFIAFWLTIAFSLSACGVVDYGQKFVTEIADTHIKTNSDLRYAGYELKWQNINDPDFMQKYEEGLSDELNERMPRILRGNRPIKITIIGSNLHNPSILTRNLPGNDPFMRIDVVVRDLSNEETILKYDEEIVDNLPPDPGGGISFRVQSVPVRLSIGTVGSLVGKLSEL